MTTPSPELRIDGSALQANWLALNAKSNGKAGAVVKANGYGLGIEYVAPTLWNAGAKDYFVATLDEAQELRKWLPHARIFDLSGFSVFAHNENDIIPVINSLEMLAKLDNRPFALQFDTGMTRLGIDMADLALTQNRNPELVMSHLACADAPSSPMNANQLKNFKEITAAFPNTPASLAATGGILMGSDYQFDLTRPGIGIYGGDPFSDAQPTIQIALPVIQIREIQKDTKIGYGGSFVAPRPMRVATLLGGYADGLQRILSNQINLFHNDIPCPILGRISMDAVTVDISALADTPSHLELFHKEQNINTIATIAGTIAYELFTSLGTRYKRFMV